MRKTVFKKVLASGASLASYLFAASPAFAQWTPTVDPFQNFTGICALVSTVVNILFGLAIAIGTIFLIIGGYTYMASGGDKVAVEAARGKITAAVTGMIIALGAYFIVKLLLLNILTLVIPACEV